VYYKKHIVDRSYWTGPFGRPSPNLYRQRRFHLGAMVGVPRSSKRKWVLGLLIGRWSIVSTGREHALKESVGTRWREAFLEPAQKAAQLWTSTATGTGTVTVWQD
jgi:hypothetical protein